MKQDLAPVSSAHRRAALRAALDRLVAAGTVASLNDWCKKAGVGFNTPSDFLKGLSESMTTRTYDKLAAAAGLTVAQLQGEAPQLSEEDRQLIADLRDMDPEERRDLMEHVRRRADAARARRRRAP